MYTPEQLVRRNASPWTKTQAILAPIQFLAFLVSFGLVVVHRVPPAGTYASNPEAVRAPCTWLAVGLYKDVQMP